MLLHIFRKSTGKIPPAEITLAQQRWEDFKSRPHRRSHAQTDHPERRRELSCWSRPPRRFLQARRGVKVFEDQEPLWVAASARDHQPRARDAPREHFSLGGRRTENAQVSRQ
jgi:hypothetical protein